jgi:hypothetical protein
MTRNTIKMQGHGIDVTIAAGSFSGLPSHCTLPHAIGRQLEAAYRQVLGRTDGSLATFSKLDAVKTRQLADKVFEATMELTYSLFVQSGGKNCYAEDRGARRAFSFTMIHDYSKED